MIMPFFQIRLLLVMLFELIGSNDNGSDYHRIAVEDSKPDNITMDYGNYTTEALEAHWRTSRWRTTVVNIRSWIIRLSGSPLELRTYQEMLQSKIPEERSLMLVFDASHSIDALFSFL